MGDIKKIFTDWKVILAFVFFIMAIVAIHPDPWVTGVAIRGVDMNSSAYFAEIQSPKPTTPPMSREVLLSINNEQINNIQEYESIVSEFKPGRSITLKTNKKTYMLQVREKIETTILAEQEYVNVTREVFNNKTNTSKNITEEILVNKTETKSLGTEDIGLSVYNAPSTNIRKGLDLQGGTRVVLQPDEKIAEDQMEMLLSNMKYRMNVYGLSDINVKEASDLSGNQYIVVEIAGAKEEEIKDLLSKQGKFFAKVGNETVFKGGNDVTYVCRTADCSGIDPRRACGESAGQWNCAFSFAITLSPEAAERQSQATKDLAVTIEEGGEKFLSEKLVLYLDDVAVDELRIGADLKGKAVTDIQISGGGSGSTEVGAANNALENMNKLQTVLITGSLPVKLNIVKIDSISPTLGEEFVQNALFMGLIAILAVSASIFVRYRKLEVSIPVIITSLVESTIMIGVAALVGQNIDVAAVAGIIIALGTGVNDQIIITDEVLRGTKADFVYDWKQKIKDAFFMIIAAFCTLGVAMIPLLFAGAGLLKGFAIMTLIGAAVGILVTRPAFAAAIEIILKK